jgi:modulator of FtsH protease HflC
MSLNKYAILFLVLVILTGILGPQAFFSVDETQVAIVTRFGEVQQTITSPGLHTKTPFVDNVIYYEKRLTLFDANPDALITSDKRRLVVDAYAIGRITDPLLFRQTVQSQQRAITRGNDIVASELRQQVANDEQIDIIRNNRQAIMEDVREAVIPKLAEFGIETVDVRIKRADFPSEIATAVYARMQAERKRIADAERADGAKQDLEIRSSVDRQATIISAEAERDANILRGVGEAEAVGIFAAALELDPEFYRFQRTLEAYRNFLTSNATVVLPADSDLFAFLQSPGDFVDEDGADLSGLQFAAGSDEQIVSDAARADLASLLEVDESVPILLGVTADEWGDASLGCPTEGESYIQVVTAGYSVELTHLGLTYTYHVSTNGANVRLCS